MNIIFIFIYVYPQIRNYTPNIIQKRKESASIVNKRHSASNVTIKTYKCPLPHHATWGNTQKHAHKLSVLSKVIQEHISISVVVWIDIQHILPWCPDPFGWHRNKRSSANGFVKPDEQWWACSGIVMARNGRIKSSGWFRCIDNHTACISYRGLSQLQMRAWSQNAPLLKKFHQKERALLIVMGRSVDEVSLDVDIDRVWMGSCHNATATPNRKNLY